MLFRIHVTKSADRPTAYQDAIGQRVVLCWCGRPHSIVSCGIFYQVKMESALLLCSFLYVFLLSVAWVTKH